MGYRVELEEIERLNCLDLLRSHRPPCHITLSASSRRGARGEFDDAQIRRDLARIIPDYDPLGFQPRDAPETPTAVDPPRPVENIYGEGLNNAEYMSNVLSWPARSPTSHFYLPRQPPRDRRLHGCRDTCPKAARIGFPRRFEE